MSQAPTTILCPYCAHHPAMASDQAALVAVHCGECAASVLPSQSVVQLVTQGLGIPLETLTGHVKSGKPGPFPCPACRGETRVVNLRLRPTHVCPTCGAASLPGGTLYALTQGKFGALKKVDPVAVEQDAAVDESKAPSPLSRLITALAYSQNARKYTYIALSVVFFTVVFAINMTHQKPVKMGKDGLPTGNLGMRPESAEALRNAVNPDYLRTPDQGDCPDGAREVRHAHGEYCELNGEKHGREYTNTCDDDGAGNETEGVWRRGKKHGRFIEKNCEGVVVNDYTYQDGDLVR